MTRISRFKTQTSCEAIISMETATLLADRVEHLMNTGRPVTLIRRHIQSDFPWFFQTGLTVRQIRRWNTGEHIGIDVQLSPGNRASLKLWAHADVSPKTDAEGWMLSQRTSKANLAEVRITGGVPGSEPSHNDRILIRWWGTGGHGEVILVAFENGPAGQC